MLMAAAVSSTVDAKIHTNVTFDPQDAAVSGGYDAALHQRALHPLVTELHQFLPPSRG